ncbi:MAG TPA: hypothetical protein VGF30_16515 [Bacteroidia bacterium]
MINGLLYYSIIPASVDLEKILLIIICSFSGIALLLFGVIMLYRSIKILDTKYLTSLRESYDELFMAVAFSEGEELEANIEKTKRLNKEHLNRKRHAEVITSELLLLYNSFTGESRKNLRELYLKAGFVEYTERKVKSRKWELQAQGIREAALMRDERVTGRLIQLSHNKNRLVKENAQLSLLKIRGFAGLDFLNEINTPLSDWHQINLIETLKEHSNSTLPDFTAWLSSNETTVILFAVRLMRHFKQIEKSEKLFPLLEYSNLPVKTEVIRTLADLQKTEVLPLLEKRFGKENTEIKTEIIKAYAILQAQNEAGLLPKWLVEAQEAEIQKHCLEALVQLDAINALNGLDIKEPVLKGFVNDLIKQQHS